MRDAQSISSEDQLSVHGHNNNNKIEYREVECDDAYGNGMTSGNGTIVKFCVTQSRGLRVSKKKGTS
jgi:hypothetical protein